MTRASHHPLRALLVLVALLLGTTCREAVAQEAPQCILEEFRSGDKLSYSRASDIVQDDRGFIWMGMWNGLCRYDGQAFQLFRADPGNDNPQTNNRITQIELDSRQNIWCTTFDSRLYLFDRQTSTFRDIFGAIDSLYFIPKSRRAIYPLTNKGVTWAVLSDGSCLRFNDADPSDYDLVQAQTHTTSDLMPGVFLITDDSHGHEWILAGWGVQIYGGPQLTGRPYFRLHEIEQRIFLASGDGSLVEYTDLYGMQEIAFPTPVQNIFATSVSRDNRILLATDAGLYIFTPADNSFKLIQQTIDGEALPEVYEFYHDARNRIWLFTNTADFYRLDPDGQIRHFAAPAEQLHSTERYHLHLMFEDGNGRVWGKARRGGLTWFDEEDQQLHSYTESLDNDGGDLITNYNTYFVDNQHNLWISATPSLFHLSFQSRQFNYIPNPQHNEVRSMLVDSLHRTLWVGDRGGYLVQRDRYNHWRYLHQDGTLSDTPERLATRGVYALIRDHRGDIWVGTRGDGIFRLHPNGTETYTVTNYKHDDKNLSTLSDNNIYTLYEDVNGHIWAGTYGGGINLIDYSSDSVHFYHHDNLMQGYPITDYDQVRCITGTRQGQILAGTTGGLLTFTSEFSHPSKVTFYQHVKRINDPTGLPGNDVMRVLHTSDNRNYVCTFGLGISEIVDDNILTDTLHYVSHLNREYPAGDVIVSGLEDRNGKLWLVADGGLTCFDPKNYRFTYFDRTDFDRDYRFTEAVPVMDDEGVVMLGLVDGLLTFHCDKLHKSDYAPRIVIAGYRYPGEEPTLCNDMEEFTLRSGQRSVSIAYAALDYHPSELLRYAYRMEGIDTSWTYANTPMVNYVNLPCGTYHLHIRSTNHDGVWCDNERILTIRVPLNLLRETWFWTIVSVLCLGGILSLLYFRYYRHIKRIFTRRKHISQHHHHHDLPPLI